MMHRIQGMSLGLLIVLAGAFASTARAEVKVSGIFGDGMVLQREMPVPVWGWAAPGETVAVQLNGEPAIETKADSEGNWKVTLPARKADGKAHTLTVSGANTITFRDVLIGEVWLGSGQSNMKLGGQNIPRDQPGIRVYHVPDKSGKLQKDVRGSWKVCGPKSGGTWSSAPLHGFGLRLHEALEVPVGVIHASWNASWIHGWFVGGPEYKGMISPLVPFAIRGVLWYQGESNTAHNKALKDDLGYFKAMQKLIEGWRKAWGRQFPFYYVQIAPHSGYPEGAAPITWHSQAAALKLPRTGMVVTTDIANVGDIHGVDRAEVGRRLALWALARDYGKKNLVYSGPLYKSMKVEGKQIRVSFAQVGSGLASRDGKPLTHFEIAGEDGKFVPAEAQIDAAKQTVLVDADGVARPAHVRFGWSNTAKPNLMNKEGLPASPFKTRDWKGGTGEDKGAE
jgi:sialate O-acetylesterase